MAEGSFERRAKCASLETVKATDERTAKQDDEVQAK